MSIVFLIVGWVGVSLICTPFIGRFLYAMEPKQASPRLLEPASKPSARRIPERRRNALHLWSRKAVRQIKIS